ncbi:MAG: hypothetical protein ICV69_10715 [Thermoleophilaceae bacterium]|nr:hypothetical protein [Thermoleophilaceae bacterium]
MRRSGPRRVAVCAGVLYGVGVALASLSTDRLPVLNVTYGLIAEAGVGLGYKPKSQFERLDVRDRDGVGAVLDRARPDALVHLAFTLNPVHDEAVEQPGELPAPGSSASWPSTCSTATSTRWSRSGSRWRPPRGS